MIAALGVLLALACVPWLLALAANVAMVRAVGRFPEAAAPDPARWPRLSIVIAACNEAETLEPALATLLAQDYPDLELVVVDDRSTDATGALLDRAAAGDPRLRVIHLTELPPGWLGKVHALHRAMDHVTGELVLFTDADVIFAPGALRRAVAITQHRSLDHLCVISDLVSRSLGVRLGVASAMRAIALSQRPWEAEDPEKSGAIGGGAFNLVRRSSFAATEGFEWLRMEVADDLGLAHLMKRAGGRAGLLAACGLVQVEWYPSVGAMFRGLEKNGFAQMARFSVARGLVLSALGTLIAIAPFVLLAWPELWVVGVVALLSNAASAVVLSRWNGVPMLDVLLSAPLGDLLGIAIIVRASVLGARRGGLVWRGTVYPLAELRAGIRVRF